MLCKILVGFVILTIVICAATIAVGVIQYTRYMMQLYNEKAYQTASTFRTYMTDEELQNYVDVAWKLKNGTASEKEVQDLVNSERYQTTRQLLFSLRESMEANDIYMVLADPEAMHNPPADVENWQPMFYIFDSYAMPDLSFDFGGRSAFNMDFLDSVLKILDTGERVDDFFISESDFGYNTSAVLPLKNADGEVIAMIGVEVPMEILAVALLNYAKSALLVIVIVTVLCMVGYMAYLYRKIVAPINLVAKEAGLFVKEENKISDRLSSVHTKDEIQDLSEALLQMELDINQYIENLTHVTAEKERIGAELDVATHIQASMLPCIFPAFPEREEFDIYATMNPAKEVGGDFYDFFMVDERHLAIVMADVSGKGVPAALFMVIGKTLIKDHTEPGVGLGDVFTEVNDMLCESNSEGLFITAFEGVLDLVTGEFVFVNAGHEMPFIQKAGGEYKPYKIRAGFVLAGMEGMRYKAGSMQLEPGDRVFQYTDGVTEATDAHNELYGMERLEAVLNRNQDKKPDELLPAVKADIDAFVGEAPQFDDITMLCMEYRERMKEV